MNRFPAIASLALLCLSGAACADAGCEEVKATISKHLASRGLKNYTLTVIGKDDRADGEVVGSCEHGAKAIVYKRG